MPRGDEEEMDVFCLTVLPARDLLECPTLYPSLISQPAGADAIAFISSSP